MESVPRRADGRRIFSAEFKQEQLARVERGELTMADLARELRVFPGAGAALQASGYEGRPGGAGRD